ncbi:MAG: hypothetical protein R3E66_03270 [bacterium]
MFRFVFPITFMLTVCGCNTFGELEDSGNPSVTNNQTTGTNNQTSGTNNQTSGTNNETPGTNNQTPEACFSRPSKKPMGSVEQVAWPTRNDTCSGMRTEPKHLDGQRSGDATNDVSIRAEADGRFLAAYVTESGVIARSATLDQATVTNDTTFPQREGARELHLAPFGNGRFYAFVENPNCVNGTQTLLTLTASDGREASITDVCAAPADTPIFAIGSAGTTSGSAAQYVWIERFGDQLVVNAMPLESFDPTSILRIPDEDLTEESTIRSTTGDLVAYSTTAGVKLWQATFGQDSDRCNIGALEPLLIDNSAPRSMPASQAVPRVEFDLVYLGDNTYVFAQVRENGVSLVRVRFNPEDGGFTIDGGVESPDIDPGRSVTTVRLAAFDGGFMLFREERQDAGDSWWYMTPYLFGATSGDWSPQPAVVSHHYDRNVTLQDVEMAAAVDSTGCGVTALIATRFDGVSDRRNIEGGSFPGLLSAQ